MNSNSSGISTTSDLEELLDGTYSASESGPVLKIKSKPSVTNIQYPCNPLSLLREPIQFEFRVSSKIKSLVIADSPSPRIISIFSSYSPKTLLMYHSPSAGNEIKLAPACNSYLRCTL